jgi:hypothetical protein
VFRVFCGSIFLLAAHRAAGDRGLICGHQRIRQAYAATKKIEPQNTPNTQMDTGEGAPTVPAR